ncbi:MAG TPA: tRNA lysidine(34) synthetase TilS [Oligoflexia bacterium]|nr:tRNA lysidine(34) synthetase TilS [Oligoflexia bacterium]HMP48614.1 tRNA lysidine(34) synthetase TilS [Oligoflexia bacterium]
MTYHVVKSTLISSFQKLPVKTGNLKVFLACSGGIDSVVLLDALKRFPISNVDFCGIVHLDHSIRQDSENDARFVSDLASRYQIPYFQKKVRPALFANSLEEWGRRERYSFFSEIAKLENADLILTAHHLDDHIETFLFRLFTGRSTASNGGIIKEFDFERKLFRPLLSVSREIIEVYAAHFSLDFVKDQTNDDVKYSRNFMRHRIIPLIRSGYPEYRSSILKNMEQANRDCSYINEQVREFAKMNLLMPRACFVNNVPACLGARVLRSLSQLEIGERALEISDQHYEKLYKVLISDKAKNEVKMFDLGRKARAVVDPCLKVNAGVHFELMDEIDTSSTRVYFSGEPLLRFADCLNAVFSISKSTRMKNRGYWYVSSNIYTEMDYVEKTESDSFIGRSFSSCFGGKKWSIILSLEHFKKITCRKVFPHELVLVPGRGFKSIGKLARERYLSFRSRQNLIAFELIGRGIIWIPGLFEASEEELTQGDKCLGQGSCAFIKLSALFKEF